VGGEEPIKMSYTRKVVPKMEKLTKKGESASSPRHAGDQKKYEYRGVMKCRRLWGWREGAELRNQTTRKFGEI